MMTETLMGTALGMVRPAIITLLLPFGNDSATGRFFRVPFSLAVALCAHPFLAPLPDQAPHYVLLLAKELAAGLFLGFLLSRLFILVGAAGAIIDQQTGYTLGNVFDPALGREMGPIETLISRLLILITMAGGGTLLLAVMVLKSFEIWPLFTLFAGPETLFSLVESTLKSSVVDMVAAAIQLAMPVVAVLLFIETGLAILGRYAQQLNPFSISLAAKAALLMLCLFGIHSYLIRQLESLVGAWWVLP